MPRETRAPEGSPAALEWAEREHVVLRQRLESLERQLAGLVEELRAGRSADATCSAARSSLNGLERQLREHFALEEQGGYFAEALAAAPRLSRRADALYREHAAFLERLGHLQALADAGRAPFDAWSEIELGMRELTTDLRAHEERENELILQAFEEDLGTP
jgi:iron-sulfur cluster repair protein YtfE (RIC family)